MRAVGAELRAAAAGEQRVAAAHRARRPFDAELPLAILRDEIPARERQGIEVVDLLADDVSIGNVALGDPHDARFRLAVENEIAVIGEELRHLRGRDSNEPDFDAACAQRVGPRGFMPMIDDRRQHEREIRADRRVGVRTARPDDLVSRARQDGGNVGHVHAGHIVELLFEIRNDAGDARERHQPGPVPADYRILTDEPAVRLQVC